MRWRVDLFDVRQVRIIYKHTAGILSRGESNTADSVYGCCATSLKPWWWCMLQNDFNKAGFYTLLGLNCILNSRLWCKESNENAASSKVCFERLKPIKIPTLDHIEYAQFVYLVFKNIITDGVHDFIVDFFGTFSADRKHFLTTKCQVSSSGGLWYVMYLAS